MIKSESRPDNRQIAKSAILLISADVRKHRQVASLEWRSAIAMAGGNRVELRGFGAFLRKKNRARRVLGRNPRTGDPL